MGEKKAINSQNKIERKVLYNLKIDLLYMLVKSITPLPVRTVQQITVSFIKGLIEFLNKTLQKFSTAVRHQFVRGKKSFNSL